MIKGPISFLKSWTANFLKKKEKVKTKEEVYLYPLN